MIKLNLTNKEIDIRLEYSDYLGEKPSVKIEGKGDLSHHLIEGLFEIVNRLSKMENCSHRTGDFKK